MIITVLRKYSGLMNRKFAQDSTNMTSLGRHFIHKTRIFYYGAPPMTYGVAGFYKFITSRGGGLDYPFMKMLKRQFNVEIFSWTKRIRYRWSPKKVYIVDAIPILFNLIKKSMDDDIIIALGYPALLEFALLLFISKLRHIPIIVRETHWYWPQTRISKFLWYIYYRLLKHVNGVIHPGKASYGYWKKHKFDNLYVINFYALESFMPECSEDKKEDIRKKFGIPQNNMVILYLGRLIKKKGVDILLKAFANLLKEKPDVDAILVIAGEGPERQRLAELSKALQITNKVYFLGPVSEFEKKCIYELADIFVYTPIVEAIPEEWPIAPLEAMSLGIPTVVSTAVGSLPDIYEGVMVVKWGDVNVLKDALCKLVNDENLRERISSKAVAVYKTISNEILVYRQFLLALLKILRRH